MSNKTIFNKFKVGDIVICHTGSRSNGRKGFIEEIVRDRRDGSNFEAMYSIYGLDPVKISVYDQDSPADYYYGDHLEYELEYTGEAMTEDRLKDYQSKLVGGFTNDVIRTIKNLGRTEGRNKD